MFKSEMLPLCSGEIKQRWACPIATTAASIRRTFILFAFICFCLLGRVFWEVLPANCAALVCAELICCSIWGWGWSCEFSASLELGVIRGWVSDRSWLKTKDLIDSYWQLWISFDYWLPLLDKCSSWLWIKELGKKCPCVISSQEGYY